MKAINSIIKLLLGSKGKDKNKLSKQRADYLLSVLALTALSDQALAKGLEKSYKIDVKKIAKEAGIEITDINNIEVTLVDASAGEIVYLGDGIFQFIPANGVTNASFLIGGTGLTGQLSVDFSSTSDSHLQETFVKSWDSFVDNLTVDSVSTVSVSGGSIGLGILGLGLALSGGSSSSEDSEDLSGAVSDGLLQDARVFLDLDGDAVYDVGEIYDITNAKGEYTLEGVTAAAKAAGTLVVRALNNETVDGVTYTTIDTISGTNVENLVMLSLIHI